MARKLQDYRQPLVADFMTKFKQIENESYRLPVTNLSPEDIATYKLRLKLMVEETFEAFEGVVKINIYNIIFKPILAEINNQIDNLTELDLHINPVTIYDSLVDQDFVNVGFANLLGLDLKAGFEEVYRSNMSKLGEDGEPIYRHDGKVLKGKNYSPPDLKSIYEKTHEVE